MFKSVHSIFKIPELKSRILFTLGMLIVIRIGSHIVIPGVNSGVVLEFMREAEGGGLFGFYDFFVGGALSRATVFALSIGPFFAAVDIIEVLGVFVPFIQRLQREGDQGQKKLYQYKRFLTLLFAVLEAYGVSIFIEKIHAPSGSNAVLNPGWEFRIYAMFTLAAGAILIMYICELLTKRGVSNGFNVIILAGIVSHLPNSCLMIINQIMSKEVSYLASILLLLLLLFTIAISILMIQGSRKIPVDYVKRVIGRRVYGGEKKSMSLKPIISIIEPIAMAQCIVLVPITIKTIFPSNHFFQNFVIHFNVHSWPYTVILGLLVVFCTYSYAYIVCNPGIKAEDLRKSMGYIPGVKPGIHTANFLDNIIKRITFPGAVFLAVIAVLPNLIALITNVPYEVVSFFGGTQLLILVFVALDIASYLESHLLKRGYNGFLKPSKIKRRRRY